MGDFAIARAVPHDGAARGTDSTLARRQHGKASTQKGSTMSNVHVRIGEYRYAYHTDPDCPALNGKPETFKGMTEIPREEAEKQDLKACHQCKK